MDAAGNALGSAAVNACARSSNAFRIAAVRPSRPRVARERRAEHRHRLPLVEDPALHRVLRRDDRRAEPEILRQALLVLVPQQPGLAEHRGPGVDLHDLGLFEGERVARARTERCR